MTAIGHPFSFYDALLLLTGFATTLLLSLAGCLGGCAGGLLIGVARLSQSRAMAPIRAVAFAYCLLFRRVPFLVTLMLVFFASQWTGANLPTVAVALLSATLIASAYLGEVVRGALIAVHVNQWEAAATLNFSYLGTLRYVILPQAWRLIVPPAFAFLVSFIKDTALASQIGVMELTAAGKVLNDKGFSPGLVYGAVLLLYFLLSYPLARLGKRLERSLAAARIR
jgi:polar amino acid transport system permease protein